MKSTKFLTSFENNNNNNSLESTYLYPSLKYKAISSNENCDVLKALINSSNQQHQKYLKLIENNNNNNIHYAATDLTPIPSTTTNNNNKMLKLVPIQQYNTSNSQTANTNLYYTIKPQSTFCNPQTTISRLNTNKLQQIQQKQVEFVSMRKIDANLLCFLDKIGESTVSNFYVGKMNTKSLSLNNENKYEDDEESNIES
jgi:hypothetical protein